MQINNFVYVMHPENGGVCIPPGEVPEWAESLITNKSVIVQAVVEVQESVEEITEEDPKGEGQNADPDPEPEAIPIPPKGGPGSSAKAWAKYAASKGFEVDSEATAASIREDLESEGIATE